MVEQEELLRVFRTAITAARTASSDSLDDQTDFSVSSIRLLQYQKPKAQEIDHQVGDCFSRCRLSVD